MCESQGDIIVYLCIDISDDLYPTKNHELLSRREFDATLRIMMICISIIALHIFIYRAVSNMRIIWLIISYVSKL